MQGPNHSHLEQGAARPLPLSSAACREASLRRSWPQQRVVQVIVAPKLGSGESMPDRAGVGAMLGKAHLGDRSHTPIRQYQIWAFAARGTFLMFYSPCCFVVPRQNRHHCNRSGFLLDIGPALAPVLLRADGLPTNLRAGWDRRSVLELPVCMI